MIAFLFALFVIEIVFPVLLYLGRNRLIFLPSASPGPETALESFYDGAQADLVYVIREDGRRLAAYDARPYQYDARGPVVLFLHGNAGNIAYRASLLEGFVAQTGLRTLLLDYSGYGGNEGTPSEEEVVRDGLAAYDYLRNDGVPAERIMLYGESLGGAVALAVADKRPCGGVVVQSTFSSLSSMARRVYPWMPLGALLTRGAFPSAERAARLEAPLLVVHGDQDRIIPFAEGQKLHEAAGAGAEFLVVAGAGHNDLFGVAGVSYLRDLGNRYRRWVKSPRQDSGNALKLMVDGLNAVDREVVAASARTATRLIPRWDVNDWIKLDEILRTRWKLRDLRFRTRPAEETVIIKRLPEAADERLAALLIMASHSNGHVRQRAIEETARFDLAANPTGLAALTVRLDDWVVPVRETAEEHWLRFAVPENLDRWTELLPTLRRLSERERAGVGPMPRRVRELFGTPAGREALRSGLRDSRPKVARASMATALESDPRPEGIVTLALASADPILRLQAANLYVAEAERPSSDVKFVERFLQDTFAAVRRLGFVLLEEHFPERLSSYVRQGLHDRSSLLRAKWQEAAVMTLDLDPVEIYRETLRSETSSVASRTGAILGLAETGDANDLPFFRAHADSEFSSVRAAVVRGLGRFAEDPSAIDETFERFHDPAPRVVRAAGAALSRLMFRPSLLMETFSATNSAAGRRGLLRLAYRLDFWDRILFAMEAFGDPDCSQTAVGVVWKSFPQSGLAIEPTQTQRSRLLESASQYEAEHPKLVEQLRYFLSLSS